MISRTSVANSEVLFLKNNVIVDVAPLVADMPQEVASLSRGPTSFPPLKSTRDAERQAESLKSPKRTTASFATIQPTDKRFN